MIDAQQEPEVISAVDLANKRNRILSQVTDKHGLYLSALTSPARDKPLSRARQEAMYRLRKELPLSYPRIARVLGRSDHTTVIHGIKAHCARNGLEVPK